VTAPDTGGARRSQLRKRTDPTSVSIETEVTPEPRQPVDELERRPDQVTKWELETQRLRGQLDVLADAAEALAAKLRTLAGS
jgi:hypothetical protein